MGGLTRLLGQPECPPGHFRDFVTLFSLSPGNKLTSKPEASTGSRSREEPPQQKARTFAAAPGVASRKPANWVVHAPEGPFVFLFVKSWSPGPQKLNLVSAGPRC